MRGRRRLSLTARLWCVAGGMALVLVAALAIRI